METKDLVLRLVRTPPRIEKPFRHALGHAIRNEFDDFRDTLGDLPDEELMGCMGLCVFTAGYVAISVCGREWPDEDNLRDIAKATTKSSFARSFGLSADDSYAYIKRVALQFEPLDQVFPDARFDAEEQRDPLVLAFKITGHLLTAYCPEELEWPQFLDKIEEANEIAAAMNLDVLPGMMLRARSTWLASARQGKTGA